MPHLLEDMESHLHIIPVQMLNASVHTAQIVPNAYVTAVPSTIPITAITMFPENFSTKNPLINAKKINPTKYPPVGPASLASPPLKS